MDAATLLLMTASVGVGFGWQPMPDGSPRVEYLVQIEPEMLAALQAGSAIPIVSEVPGEIGPVGRVRIVIGRETLPRQNLSVPLKTIRNKPTSDTSSSTKAPSSMTSGAPYSTVQQDPNLIRTQFTTPATPLPGSGAPGSGQPSGVSSSSAPGQYTPAPALLGNRSGGTMYQKAIDAGERQAAAAQAGVAQSVSAMGAELQVKLNEQQQQFANQLRQAASSANPTASSANPTGANLSRGPAMNRPAGVGMPGGATPGFGQPATPGNSSAYSQPTAAANGTFQGARLDQPVPTGPVSVASPGSTSPGPRLSTGLVAGSSVSGTSVSGASAPGLSLPRSATLPAGKPYSHAPARPGFPVAASSTGPAGNSQLPPVVPAGQSPPGIPLQTAQPHPTLVNNAHLQPAQPQPASGSEIFALLLAWVLLMGSVAGNIYLFWSYLDIRGKYQTMIRTNRAAPPQYSRAA